MQFHELLQDKSTTIPVSTGLCVSPLASDHIIMVVRSTILGVIDNIMFPVFMNAPSDSQLSSSRSCKASLHTFSSLVYRRAAKMVANTALPDLIGEA